MFKRKRSAKDFSEELQAHIELEAEELQREGLSEEEAHRQARLKFGSVRREQERFHMRGRWASLDHWLRDLKHALRSLVDSPGFTITAVVTLALGVGANSAVFSVMHAVLLRSLPVNDADRLVYLQTTHAPHGTGTVGAHDTFSYPVYAALRNQNGAMETVMAYVPLSASKVAVRIGTQPEEAEGDMVSGDFFSGLGVRLERGRGFTEDDEKDHAPFAVISDAYWTRRFARSPDVLGTTLYANGVGLTIVGVAARGFEGLEAGRSTDFWIPLQSRPELNAWGNPLDEGKVYITNPTWWCLRLIGRLRPAVTKAQALAQMQPVFQAAAYEGLGAPAAGENKPVLSLGDARGFPALGEQYGKPLRMLMGLVGLVLLIALTNVAMLLMARNTTRQREFSMKLALGAGRGDLLRQLLAESLLLVTAGGLLAWIFAIYATRALGAWAQIEASLAPDGAVLRFTVAVLAVAVVLFGAVPLRIAMSAGPSLAVKTSAAVSGADTGKTRMGRIVVVLQMTICVVLLVAAGLLIRTLRGLENTPLGFNTDGLAVFGVKPEIHSLEQGREFYRDLTVKLRQIPGVESVGLMMWRIGSWSSDNTEMRVNGKLPDVPNGGSRRVRINVVGPGFFGTLGVPLVEGRDFADSDTASSLHVGIINEEFARRFLPGQNPLGHVIETERRGFPLTIVGVVKDHKFRSIDEEPIPMAWYEYAQIPVIGRMDVELRVHGEPLAILPAARKVVQQMDPTLPLIQPMTQRAQYDLTISSQMLFARLAGFFGILAVALVAAGLYGTLAYRVSRRTAEIGIRMAMGARRGQVVWMILKDSLVLTAIGVAVGVPSAMLVGRALTSSLYGVTPLDGASYALAIGGVACVALAASAWPARRAANVEPLTALRTD
ncbi:ABC transporter permease [Occallatibacter riparius]|uniref:ABC transporter permease n=1 Tax=Occallatibacter riparius TaxID=1002689 RepID=A0A9J7BPG2_9BACT|nr:ABC transporter permease [Occallatibacter riparius]UWZ84600.1 ABC transporter permease [Occallatibacter riparius]